MDIRYVASVGYDLFGGFAGEFGGKGSIELEPGWQLVSIPIKFGYWNDSTHTFVHDGTTVAKFSNYVLSQIEDLYGTGKVEVANTYTGDAQAFFSFVPGITPDSSPNNFQLVYTDGSNDEISGFWLKSLHSTTMTIDWGE